MIHNNKDRINEVTFANHLYEFMRFYKKHRDLNNEVSGLKSINYYDDKNQVNEKITKYNFEYAIKRVSAFIIDNIQYIKNKKDMTQIELDVEILEEDFLNDSKYKDYVKKRGMLGSNNLVDFNIRYFNYVIRCFKLSNKINVLLQDSLMITTSDIKKSIQFYDLKMFYEQLGYYRDEISNDISMFKYSNIINHTKRIFGYYYTYKLMVNKNEVFYIEKLISICVGYLQLKQVFKMIEDARDTKLINENKLNEIKKSSLEYKRILKEIYKLVNKSLSERGILPKINKKKFIDTSLI